MAGVPSGTVLFEADRDVDVGVNLAVGFVVGEGAAAERFDIGEVDLGPDRCLGILKLVARADDVDFAEAGDEAGDVGVSDLVLVAEGGQFGEEVVAVVEGDTEAAAEGEFMAAHGRSLSGRGRIRPVVGCAVAAGCGERRRDGLPIAVSIRGEESLEKQASLEWAEEARTDESARQ